VTSAGRLQGVPPGAQQFAAAKPRAAVVATADLPLWPLLDLTSQDAAAVLWRTKDKQFPEIVIASAYANITKPAVPVELVNIAAFCASQSLPFIVGVDTNAHSALWGCQINNAHGDAFELFMLNNSLSVLNTRGIPTFCTQRSASIIYVTLASDCLLPLTGNWRVVVETDFFSDHRLLQFELLVCPSPLAPVKNYLKTD
jgi:hypothetical protein